MLNRSNSLISLTTISGEENYETLPIHSSHDANVQPLRRTQLAFSVASSTASSHPQYPHLCPRCQTFSIQSFARKPPQRKGFLLSTVQLGASQGCQFCALLLRALDDVRPPEYFYHNIFVGRTVLDPEVWVHLSVSRDYADGEGDGENGRWRKGSGTKGAVDAGGLRVNRLSVEVGDRFSGVRNSAKHEVCLAADPASPAARSGDILGRYIGRDPTSASHYSTARTWLQECVSHTKCNETVSGSIRIDPQTSPLPTRVIEITYLDSLPHLYMRETSGRHGAYITLTHRWNASTAKCITTTSNYSQRLAGENFGELPQLFADAITIASNLGIQYLWIDSICIIQSGDDLADWRREAPKMAQYYQFSIFTLAGTGEDMSGGVLHAYEESAVPWEGDLVRLPYVDKSGTMAGDIFAYMRRLPLISEYTTLVRSSILFRRGWILQEWLLSKRLLWYTPHGLFFECQESLPRAYDQSQITFSRAGAELQSHLRLKAQFHWLNSDILTFWYHALEVYSGQHLTKPELDRVLAVAGLAKEVSRILANPQRVQRSSEQGAENEVYVAGLWLHDIHHGLLWEKKHHVGEEETGIVSNAPSWSWASLLTELRWPERNKGTKTAFTVSGICFEQRKTHDIPSHLVIENCKLRPFNPATENPAFDPSNMYSCLHIRGKLHTVHIRGYLETEENLKNAALSTAYAPVPKACSWRAVCSAWKPDAIAGWGSLERLQPHPSACDDYGIAVYALHVSTRYLRYGVWIKSSVPVLDVVFLEEIPLPAGGEHVEGAAFTNRFRRIGVGRIADAELIAEFADAEERDIQLI